MSDTTIVIQIVLPDGHGFRCNSAGLNGIPDTLCHLFQKIIVRICRAFLQLQHNVLCVAVYGVAEVTGLIDFLDEFIHHSTAILALVVLKTGNNGFAVVVDALDLQHQTAIVVFHFDLRIYAQKYCAGRFAFEWLGKPAAGQQRQSQNGESADGKAFFPIHFLHGWFSLYVLFSRLVDRLMNKEYGTGFLKPG